MTGFLHAAVNAATFVGLIVLITIGAVGLVAYWPRIVAALKGRGGHG